MTQVLIDGFLGGPYKVRRDAFLTPLDLSLVKRTVAQEKKRRRQRRPIELGSNVAAAGGSFMIFEKTGPICFGSRAPRKDVRVPAASDYRAAGRIIAYRRCGRMHTLIARARIMLRHTRARRAKHEPLTGRVFKLFSPKIRDKHLIRPLAGC
jgi:hypothetical protein